jgi:alpha-galactosidase
MDEQVAAFAKMRDALAATGRPIVYSINSNSIHDKTGPLRDWSDVAP